MQTDNLELKKLVYLYLMNYAKSQPDMAIMAVNTFVKVSRSPVEVGMRVRACIHMSYVPVSLKCRASLSYMKLSGSFADLQASFCPSRLRASSSSRGLPLSPEPQT